MHKHPHNQVYRVLEQIENVDERLQNIKINAFVRTWLARANVMCVTVFNIFAGFPSLMLL